MEVVHDGDSFEVCFKNNRTVGSLGVFFGDNPLEFVFPITLLQIIITVVTSRTLYHLLRPLQTPRFICSVLVSFNTLKPSIFFSSLFIYMNAINMRLIN